MNYRQGLGSILQRGSVDYLQEQVVDVPERTQSSL